MIASTPTRRPGAVLFEVLLSIALFVGAAAFALGATRSVLTALDRSGREALALDLARAKMAELEAGLVTITQLREDADGIERVGSVDPLDEADATPGRGGPRWVLTVRTERTEFQGLNLVELTVEEDPAPASGEEPTTAKATLRQLVRLREGDTAESFETDPMLRGLPDDPGPTDEGGAP